MKSFSAFTLELWEGDDAPRFMKTGTETGKDFFRGKWKADYYNVEVGTNSLQLTVKSYGYTAEVNIFGATENAIGPVRIKSILAFIKKKYPKVHVIEGNRISGARKDKAYNKARVRIRDDDDNV